ncbi:MAG: DHH family phosphoesterase [Promethearchaeota archaeon]|jgi:nanoRNase/pAp phosphatase (c-di-AMP/oligoRNAs hydrolase)
MLNSRYKDFLSFLKGKKILITTHDLVDFDGFASCFALKFFLIEYLKNSDVSIFFSDLSKSVKFYVTKFSEKFPGFTFFYIKDVKLSNFDVCLIIDANSISQIRFNREKVTNSLEIPYIIIDHHHYNEKNPTKENLNNLNLIDENFSSTAEIILNLFESFSQSLPLPYKYLIISAILTDSGFFKHGNNKTVKNMSVLLNSDLDFQEARSMLNREVDVSEKIAKIKGLQRVELIREGDFLIGMTDVSSFGAKVATMLINIGFDISFVHSKEKNQHVINGRAGKSICSKTHLHLGKIFEEIAMDLGGSGGGHDGAAALTFDTNIDEIKIEIIEKIKQTIRSKF